MQLAALFRSALFVSVSRVLLELRCRFLFRKKKGREVYRAREGESATGSAKMRHVLSLIAIVAVSAALPATYVRSPRLQAPFEDESGCGEAARVLRA